MYDTTQIILAILALLGNCGWFLSGRKYRQEVRKSKAEANKADFDLAKEYIKEFKENIYAPLEAELQKLRTAIEKVSNCDYVDICPVLHQLHDEQVSHRDDNSDDRGRHGSGGTAES